MIEVYTFLSNKDIEFERFFEEEFNRFVVKWKTESEDLSNMFKIILAGKCVMHFPGILWQHHLKISSNLGFKGEYKSTIQIEIPVFPYNKWYVKVNPIRPKQQIEDGSDLFLLPRDK